MEDVNLLKGVTKTSTACPSFLGVEAILNEYMGELDPGESQCDKVTTITVDCEGKTMPSK